MSGCQLQRFELLDYAAGERLQERLVELRKRDATDDQLLLLEHLPVITLGRGGDLANLTAPAPFLEARGVAVVRTGRGGEITFHGPGQMVAYPILKLPEPRRDLHRYLRDLEQVVIDSLPELPLERIPGKTGVWCQQRKICSLGVRASSWVTSHGLALNRLPQEGFEWMIPCGLEGVKMTSLEQEGLALEREELEKRFCAHFARIFELDIWT